MRLLSSFRAYPRLVASQLLIMRREPYYWVIAVSLAAVSMIAFGYLFDEPNTPRIGVVDEDRSETSRQLIGRFAEIDDVDVTVGNRDAELEALSAGDRWAVAVIEEESGRLGRESQRVDVYYNAEDSFAAATGKGLIRQVLADASTATDPERPEDSPVIRELPSESTNVPSFIELLVPGMVGMSIMWGNLSAGLWVVWWRQTGVLKRLGVAPLRPLVLQIAQVTAVLCLSLVQVSFLLLLGWVLFDVGVEGDWIALGAVVLLGILSMIGVGYVFGAFLPTTTAFGAVVNLCAVLMLFLGGSYQPVRDPPTALEPLVNLVPLTYLNQALRDVINRGASFEEVWNELAILSVWVVASALVSVRIFRWT